MYYRKRDISPTESECSYVKHSADELDIISISIVDIMMGWLQLCHLALHLRNTHLYTQNTCLQKTNIKLIVKHDSPFFYFFF